jgi:hypothetical protein
MPDTQPGSWRTIVYGTPVTTSDGMAVGSVREVLGSDAEDVFHGIRVELGHGQHDVLLPAGDVAAISRDGIATGLTQPEFATLDPYDETASYHLAMVGRWRRHLAWKADSKSDEEPG